jgi:diadenosine tetraphosphate (Ap4A) HIT family hydrolase
MTPFQPSQDLVVLQTDDWVISHRADCALPGYLMVGARTSTSELFQLPPRALSELGTLLASAQLALNKILNPEHLYIGRYGHMAGYSIHFHVIPVCRWVKQTFFMDPRYRILQQLSDTSCPGETDGAELTLFIWREFCESRKPPAMCGPDVSEVVRTLRTLMAETGLPPARSS